MTITIKPDMTIEIGEVKLIRTEPLFRELLPVTAVLLDSIDGQDHWERAIEAVMHAVLQLELRHALAHRDLDSSDTGDRAGGDGADRRGDRSDQLGE